jgi:hypothetical protein
MRALLCKEHGLPDSWNWWTLTGRQPQAEKGQVVIDIRAAGLNFPDVLIIQGKYQFQPEMPFVAGRRVRRRGARRGRGRRSLQGRRQGDRHDRQRLLLRPDRRGSERRDADARGLDFNRPRASR